MRRIVALIVVLGMASAAFAANEQPQEKIRELRKKAEEEKRHIKRLGEQEKGIRGKLTQINRSIAELRKKITEAEKNQVRMAKELEQLNLEHDRLSRQLTQRTKESEQRLVLWHRSFLLKRETPFTDLRETVLFENYMRRIFDYDTTLIRTIRSDQEALRQSASRVASKKQQLEHVEADLKVKRGQFLGLEQEQSQLLGKVSHEKSLHAQDLKKTEEAIRSLEALMQKAKGVPEYAGRRSGSGMLPRPVNGDIVGRFGMEQGVEKGAKFNRKGIEIRATDGAPAKAVDHGKVVYTGWIKGLGEVCIVSHGSSLYSVYGRLSSVAVKAGQEIRQSDVIGRVGKEAALYEFPTLYFEIRQKDKPVNPESWIR